MIASGKTECYNNLKIKLRLTGGRYEKECHVRTSQKLRRK